MKFWKDQTNSHNIYELDYELLTNNQETEIKSLINFLDFLNTGWRCNIDFG